MLFSLIPPSCIVAPIRELVNTLFPSPLNHQSNQLMPSTSQQIDIEINRTRYQSISSSSKLSRDSSILSNVLSMDYVESVKAQANIPMWAEQMDNKNPWTLSFSYTTAKEGMSNFANTVLVNKSMHIPHAIETINSCTPQTEVNNNSTISQGIKLSIISYKVNQPINCHIQVHPSRNYIPTVISSPNYTSLPSTVAIFLATRLLTMLQLSGYSVIHGGDTPIRLGLS